MTTLRSPCCEQDSLVGGPWRHRGRAIAGSAERGVGVGQWHPTADLDGFSSRDVSRVIVRPSRAGVGRSTAARRSAGAAYSRGARSCRRTRQCRRRLGVPAPSRRRIPGGSSPQWWPPRVRLVRTTSRVHVRPGIGRKAGVAASAGDGEARHCRTGRRLRTEPPRWDRPSLNPASAGRHDQGRSARHRGLLTSYVISSRDGQVRQDPPLFAERAYLTCCATCTTFNCFWSRMSSLPSTSASGAQLLADSSNSALASGLKPTGRVRSDTASCCRRSPAAARRRAPRLPC